MVVPLIYGEYVPRSPVDPRNHRWYQTLHMLCFFLYVYTYDKD